MKKFLINTLGYLFLILILGNIIAIISGYFLSKSYFYKPDFIINHFAPNTHFNYILAGSSRGLTTINTVKVDEELGIKGLNISMDDTGLPSQFLMIQHYFESGFSSNYCILTLDIGHFEESERKLSDNDYRFISFSDRPYVNEYYDTFEKGIIRPLTLSKYFPILAFSFYNMELFWSSGLAAIKPKYTNRFDFNGNYSYPDGDDTQDSKEIKFSEIELEMRNPILAELSSYLKRKDCKLLIYVAPYSNLQLAITNSHGYEVINHSGSLKLSNYFFDSDHVNGLGKIKATELFIAEISNLIY